MGMMALEHEQPVRFERRGLWLFLGSLSAAALSWIPVLIYRQHYPPNSVDPGDLDLGGAGLASITLFVSAYSFSAGSLLLFMRRSATSGVSCVRNVLRTEA